MNALTTFAQMNFTPLIARDNPALRSYIRDRGLDSPVPYEVVNEQSTLDGGAHLPSDDLLSRQMAFEGLSPLQVESHLSAAQRAESTTAEVQALADRLSSLTSPYWLSGEAEAQRMLERKGRVAHWWRLGAKYMLMWSLVSAGALVVLTAVLARHGSSLTPAVIAGGVLSIVVMIVASVTVAHRSRVASSKYREHPTALWAQAIAALEYSALQPLLIQTQSHLRDFLTEHTTNLGGLLQPLQQAEADLEGAIQESFWHYRAITAHARDAAVAQHDQAVVALAEEHLEYLDRLAGALNSPLADHTSDFAHASFHEERNLSSDRFTAIALSAVFALIASSAVMGLPSVAIANDKCSYAVAQVRIADCENLTELSASGLDLSKVDLTDKDVSASNFSEANLTEAKLNQTNLDFSNLNGATLSKVEARAASLNGVFAQGSEFDEAILEDAVISDADLSNASFANANVRNSNLGGSLLANAILRSSDAEGANFSQANASGADFSDANLKNALMIDVDLSGASLKGAQLSGTDFTGAVLTGIDFTEADFSEAILNGVNLSGLDLSGLDLSDYSLAGADLSNANLTNTSLEGANLIGADLTGATITGLKLSGATLGGVSVKALLDGGADLEGVDLSGADLTGLAGSEINLPGATLNGVDLAGFDLTGANLAGSSLSGADLNGAVLTGADLSNADLSDASLSVSELSEANFAGANFNRADLSDARALDSDFTGASFTAASLDGADFSSSNMRNASGLGSNAAAAQWVDATCPNGQTAEICRS